VVCAVEHDRERHRDDGRLPHDAHDDDTSLPEAQYCSSNGVQTLTTSGSNAVVRGREPAVSGAAASERCGGRHGVVDAHERFLLHRPVLHPGHSSYTAQLLPGGDLYLLTGTGSSYSSTGNLWSAAACAWNYTAPQLQATATYCGVFPDGSRLSMVLEPVSQTLTALLQPASSATNVCFYRGVVNVRPMDMAVSPMMYCTGSNHYLGQIVRDAANPSTLTVFVLVYNTNTWMNVTLSNGTCTAWETGLASGEYCTPQGWTMTPGVLVFGSYISFPQGSSVYIANYSIVGTNVTINPSQVYGWNSGNPTYGTAPSDVYINTVGTGATIGLSLSSYGNGMPYTIAATRFGCPWSTSNVSAIADVAMASAVLPAPFNGRIMAVFHYMGNFTMLLPPTNSSAVASRCYVNGVFQVMPGNGQLSLQVSQSSPGCTYSFEFSSAMWNAATNAVTFNLWYPYNTTMLWTLPRPSAGQAR
jgi:hypothetical protein